MKKLNIELINLPHEQIIKVKEAYLILGENSLVHHLDYKSSTMDINDTDPMLNKWGDVENVYRRCTAKKGAITNVEVRSTDVIEGEQNIMLVISGEDLGIVIFFHSESFKLAKEMEQEILQWLGWK